MDTASVLRAALELFTARQYPGVVVVCAEAIEHDPDNLHLRILRVRALIALRWLDEAREELAECARIDVTSSVVYRLLGEVALRSDRPDAALVFLREALSLDPADVEAQEWLGIASSLHRAQSRPRATPPPPFRPTTAAEKLPAAAAVVGHFVSPSSAPEQLPAADAEEGPFFRPLATAGKHPAAVGARGHFVPGRASSPPPGEPRATSPAPRALGTSSGTALPTASGFGNYLVEIGVLSDPQLRAALAYKRATGVRLGRAVTTLGFATELKIEWASLAYHGRHVRPGERSIWDSEPTPPEHTTHQRRAM